MGTGKQARDRRVVWQHSAARERRDNRTLYLRIDRAQQVADGKRPIKVDRLVKVTGDKPGIDQASIDETRIVIGLTGYVTNIPAAELDGAGVIAAYHDLFQVEKSFRMAKTDLRARPIFHHKRDSIEAHLTIVFAALAIGRDLENRTGVSIRRIIQELKPLRDVTITALGHDLTATTPPSPAAAAILEALKRRDRESPGHQNGTSQVGCEHMERPYRASTRMLLAGYALGCRQRLSRSTTPCFFSSRSMPLGAKPKYRAILATDRPSAYMRTA